MQYPLLFIHSSSGSVFNLNDVFAPLYCRFCYVLNCISQRRFVYKYKSYEKKRKKEPALYIL